MYLTPYSITIHFFFSACKFTNGFPSGCVDAAGCNTGWPFLEGNYKLDIS
jgi:hypothetical protein